MTSDDLGVAMQAMRSGKVCDCSGQVMTFRGAGDPTFLHPGKLRNATIQLRGGSLTVKCRGVLLENVTVAGGARGVCVKLGGGVSMTDCEVRNCGVGVCVQGGSNLKASNLKVLDSTADAIYVKSGSSVTIMSCEIDGAGNHGICVSNSSRVVGSRMLITGVQGDVLSVTNAARLSLKQCTLTNNAGELGRAANASSLNLAGCTFEGRFVESNAGKVRITRS